LLDHGVASMLGIEDVDQELVETVALAVDKTLVMIILHFLLCSIHVFVLLLESLADDVLDDFEDQYHHPVEAVLPFLAPLYLIRIQLNHRIRVHLGEANQ